MAKPETRVSRLYRRRIYRDHCRWRFIETRVVHAHTYAHIASNTYIAYRQNGHLNNSLATRECAEDSRRAFCLRRIDWIAAPPRTMRAKCVGKAIITFGARERRTVKEIAHSSSRWGIWGQLILLLCGGGAGNSYDLIVRMIYSMTSTRRVCIYRNRDWQR